MAQNIDGFTDIDVVKDLTYSHEKRHYTYYIRLDVPYYQDYSTSRSKDGIAYYMFNYLQREVKIVNDVFLKADGSWQYWKAHSIDGTYPAPRRVYFKNNKRDKVTYTSDNCVAEVMYYSRKADFSPYLYANSTYINPNTQEFVGYIDKTETFEQYSLSSATMYFKKPADSSYQSVPCTIVRSDWFGLKISASASLERSAEYNVYFTATADDGTTKRMIFSSSGTNFSEMTFSTVDAAASATCVEPSGSVENGHITFRWIHSTDNATKQYAFDLQYKESSSNDWTVVADHVVSDSSTITADISVSGVYQWRVRTYNQSDAPSSWATASFVNKIALTPPSSILASTAGRPIVTWTSSAQRAYQLQMLLDDSIVYDSGVVYSGDSEHFVDQYFDSSVYAVRVRVFDLLGDSSDWSEAAYQQPTVDPLNATVLQNENGGINITVPSSDVFTKYYVRRNGVLIAKLDGQSFRDKYAIGRTNYEVIGVTKSDNSSIYRTTINALYPHAVIIAHNQIFDVNRRAGNAVDISTGSSPNMEKVQFLGDTYPSYYASGSRSTTFSIVFTSSENIEDLLGGPVFYADNFGNGGWCAVTGYSKTDNFDKFDSGDYSNEISLTLERTSYDESINYDL